MEIIISFILCVVLVIADSIKLDSDRMKGKIVNGSTAYDQQKYMASLQLDGKHICSSGLIKKGFLLSSGQCVWRIEEGLLSTCRDATAVLGASNLKKGQRIKILKAMVHPRFDILIDKNLNNRFDLGVVMLADDVDYTRVKILNIPTELRYFHLSKKDGSVCGWGSSTNIDKDDYIGTSEFAENLQCMSVILLTHRTCTQIIYPGDFKRFMLCALAIYLEQTVVSGDVGSPLTVKMYHNGAEENYAVGVTLHRFEHGKNKFYRFIRIERAYPDIQEMIRELNFITEVTMHSSSSSSNSSSNNQQDSTNEGSKRRKFQ